MNDLCNIVGRASFVASLLKPHNARQRNRVYLTLLADHPEVLASEFARHADNESIKSAADLYRALSKSSSARTYRQRLYFDLQRQHAGAAIRNILTTGLLVKIIYAKCAELGGFSSTERAVEFLCEKYTTNILIAANRLDTRQAWFRTRAAAPMAAALLQFIQDNELTKFDGAAFTLLKDQICDVLANATSFQSILLSPLRRGDKPFMKSSELLSIPACLKKGTASISPALPSWGRRST